MIIMTEENIQAPKMFHPNSDAIEDFLFRFAFQNYIVLTAVKQYEQEKASRIGSCLPRSVNNQTHHKVKARDIETTICTELVTIVKAIHSTQKSAIGTLASCIRRKQKDGESIESFSRALNNSGNQCENKRTRIVSGTGCNGLS